VSEGRPSGRYCRGLAGCLGMAAAGVGVTIWGPGLVIQPHWLSTFWCRDALGVCASAGTHCPAAVMPVGRSRLSARAGCNERATHKCHALHTTAPCDAARRQVNHFPRPSPPQPPPSPSPAALLPPAAARLSCQLPPPPCPNSPHCFLPAVERVLAGQMILRPFLRRALSSLRPVGLAMRVRKPDVRRRALRRGWW
jgi:hypothetical protein